MALFSKLRIPSHVRLFLIFLITFIIPFSVLTIVFVQSYRDIYREQVTQSCKYEMDSVATLIDTQFQTSARHIAMLTQDETLVSHLRASVHPDYEVPEDTPSLQEMVRDYIVATPSMLNTKVVVLSKNNDVLLGSEYIGNLHTNAEFQEMIQSSYRSPLKSTIWFSDQHFSKSDVND